MALKGIFLSVPRRWSGSFLQAKLYAIRRRKARSRCNEADFQPMHDELTRARPKSAINDELDQEFFASYDRKIARLTALATRLHDLEAEAALHESRRDALRLEHRRVQAERDRVARS